MLSEDLVKSFVGMTESAVFETVKELHDIIVTRRDDEFFMSDNMLNNNRVKLEIEKDIVVKAVIG